MQLTDVVSLVILSLTWGAQITLRSLLVRYWKLMWIISLVLIFGIVGYWVYLQYQGWHAGAPGKYLLPPYQSINYFYSYAGSRIFGPWLIALLASVLVSRLAEVLNRRSGERFFEREEIHFFAIGLFLTGYPGFLFYITFVLLYELILTLYRYFFKEQKRVPLYFAWLPLAIFAILVRNWLLPHDILTSFNL